MKIRPALLASTLALSMAPVHALPSPEWAARFFIDMYAYTCVKNVGRPDLILKDMKTRKAEELPKTKASSYLRGGTGKAWSIRNIMGEFIVSMRDDGACSLEVKNFFARSANVNTYFADLVEHLPPPGTKVTKLRDTKEGHNLRMVSYGWAADESIQRIIFALNTRQEGGASMTAVAIVSLVE